MGSLLSLALANLFMSSNEQKWLKSDHCRLVKFYRRYVNNLFCFPKKVSIRHQPNLNQTIEKEHVKEFPLLDVFNSYSNKSKTKTYIHMIFTELQQLCTIYI